MKVRLIAAGLVALALVSAPATLEAQQRRIPDDKDAPRYSGREVGPTPVGSIPDVRLRDNDRNRDIELTIDYPTRGGSHPLIVLSPGFGGTHRGYVGLSTYWAGNNYVVVRVNHADAVANVQSAEDVWGNATPADWKNRVRDVTFILDSIPALIKSFPELEGKIDATKVAVAGHSYGSHTAMLLGGAKTFPGGVSYADPRVTAIVAMSPQGPSDQRGFTNESWAELKVPTLFLTGTMDQGAMESETPEWRAESFRLSPAGDKWLVTLEGAGRITFAGGAAPGLIEQIARERGDRAEGVSIPLAPDPRDPGTIDTPGSRAPSARDVMNQRAVPRGSKAENMALKQRELFAISRGLELAFFDTYLRGDAAARAELEKVAERKGVRVEKK
jgi:predicted dienelactone hydrolase